MPSRDLFIEKDSSINEHIEQMRLSATKSLLERRDVVIVATVSAIYGIGDPADYHSMILHLREGEKMSQRDVIRRLAEMQYERNELDFRRGTFRVRGDVIDIFPAENAEHRDARRACSTTRSRRSQLFDPLTGHDAARRCRASPSIRRATTSRRATTTLRAVETIKAELRERIEFFQKAEASWSRRSASSSARASTSRCWPRSASARASRTTRATCRGAQAGEPPPTLIDYLPRDALMFIDESHVTIPQLGGMYKRRPCAQGEPGRLRLPPAVRARQPAAALRRVRAA